MSTDIVVPILEEGYSSDEGTPELTREEIQNSVYEFDASFEFEAPQWFDFTDNRALYSYEEEIRDPQLEEGEWISGDAWFAVIHEGHEPEYYGYAPYESGDTIDDIDIGFGAQEDAVVAVLETPKKAVRLLVSQTSPIARSSPPSPTLCSTPSQPRKRPGLSPLTTNVDSPLRGGAVRIRAETHLATTTSASCTKQEPAQLQAKRTGPQRLLVQDSPPHVSPPKPEPTLTKKPSSYMSPTSSSTHRREASANKSPTSSTNSSTVLPRYMDTTKPTHIDQCPPKAYLSNRVGKNTVRVTQRAPVAKRTNAPPSAKPAVSVPSPPRSTISTPSLVGIENRSSPQNALLKQADALISQHKQNKQKTVYEPRRFGIKEIKAWELVSGVKWFQLTSEERQIANEQMEEMRRNGEFL